MEPYDAGLNSRKMEAPASTHTHPLDWAFKPKELHKCQKGMREVQMVSRMAWVWGRAWAWVSASTLWLNRDDSLTGFSVAGFKKYITFYNGETCFSE